MDHDPVNVGLFELSVEYSIAPCPETLFLPAKLGDLYAALRFLIKEPLEFVQIGIGAFKQKIPQAFNPELEGADGNQVFLQQFDNLAVSMLIGDPVNPFAV